MILIVDDNLETCRAMERLLRHLGYEVATTSGGLSALALLRWQHWHAPDLIILDVRMPEIDGWSLLNAIRTHPTLKEAPIVMYSAEDDPQYRAMARRMGADYLPKTNLSPDLLAERLCALAGPPR